MLKVGVVERQKKRRRSHSDRRLSPVDTDISADDMNPHASRQHGYGEMGINGNQRPPYYLPLRHLPGAQAACAYSDTPRSSVNHRPDFLQIQLKFPMRNAGNLSACAARAFGCASTGHRISVLGLPPADVAFSCHGSLLRKMVFESNRVSKYRKNDEKEQAFFCVGNAPSLFHAPRVPFVRGVVTAPLFVRMLSEWSGRARRTPLIPPPMDASPCSAASLPISPIIFDPIRGGHACSLFHERLDFSLA